jgi:ketosteroid isomerase-like protein
MTSLKQKFAAAVLAAALSVPAAAMADEAASEGPVRQYLKAWDARDVEAMLKTFTDDTVVILPAQAPISGTQNLRGLLTAFVKSFSEPGATFTPGQFTANGQVAYLLWQGDTPSGRYPFGADTFVVRDGHIAYLTLAFVAEPKPAKN